MSLQDPLPGIANSENIPEERAAGPGRTALYDGTINMQLDPEKNSTEKILAHGGLATFVNPG
jgi:hypothetical protein